MMSALWFEDFEAMDPDEEIVSPARTVTEADVVAFAAWSGDQNPMHTDAVFAEQSPFGERVAHGVLGVSFCLGLLSRTGEIEGTGLALLGIDRWRFRAPIRFGDTVHVRAAVIETRRTSRSDRGIVRRALRLIDQHGAVSQDGEMSLLVRRQPAVD
jgi:acyl dehydratase